MRAVSMVGKKKLLYVFEDGPYSGSAGIEALDAVLIGASFEQEISLLFLNDGVFQLNAGQSANSQPTGLKQYTNAFKALSDFDVHQIFVHDLSLIARGLSQKELLIDTRLLDSPKVAQLIAQQDKVFTF